MKNKLFLLNVSKVVDSDSWEYESNDGRGTRTESRKTIKWETTCFPVELDRSGASEYIKTQYIAFKKLLSELRNINREVGTLQFNRDPFGVKDCWVKYSTGNRVYSPEEPDFLGSLVKNPMNSSQWSGYVVMHCGIRGRYITNMGEAPLIQLSPKFPKYTLERWSVSNPREVTNGLKELFVNLFPNENWDGRYMEIPVKKENSPTLGDVFGDELKTLL